VWLSNNSFSFVKPNRNNLNFYHFGEDVSYLNGITIIGEKQHVDHYTLVQHASPNCESQPKIIKEFSINQQVFSTENFRRESSAKNKCVQKSNNILLSDKQQSTKPQLEILPM
jgi:Fe-S cluster assembly protein SufD